MHYRRAKTPGATYFFTVVTHNRQPLFQNNETIALLRQAFHTVKAESPFTVDAIVVLPEHIHSIWPCRKATSLIHSGNLGGSEGLVWRCWVPLRSTQPTSTERQK
jgi:REP element-mobilizing transposase RayT